MIAAQMGQFKVAFQDMISWPKLGIGALRVWQRNYLYYKKYFVASIFWNFTEPVLYMVAFGYGLGFFVGEIAGIPYRTFFAPAILATTAMQGAVFESTYSSFTKMKIQKTYETIMMTPVSIENIIAGEILWAATKAFISSLAVAVVFLVLGLLEHGIVVFAFPVLFLLAWCMSAMGMVMTTYARDYDSFTYFFSLLITPMSLLAGTFFPLDHFPRWAQAFAQFLPLTHGVVVIRSLFLGHWDHFMFANVAILLVMALLFSNWAIANARRRLIH